MDLYYFRIKATNKDVATNYNLILYSPVFVVNRKKNVPLTVNQVFPSPFSTFIGVTFTDNVNADVQFDVYDVVGRSVYSQKLTVAGIYQELKMGSLAKGIYVVSVKIGDAEPQSFKLFGGN